MEAYKELQDLSCGIRSSKIKDQDFPTIANSLRAQLQKVKNAISELDFSKWEGDFVVKCNEIEESLLTSWNENHLSLASGKLIFEYLQKKYQINQSPIRIKLALMEQHAKAKTNSWEEINSLLNTHLKN